MFHILFVAIVKATMMVIIDAVGLSDVAGGLGTRCSNTTSLAFNFVKLLLAFVFAFKGEM